VEKSTEQFLEEVHKEQANDEKNRRTQGKGTPSEKLPTKQHTNNP
jgi:hypothetical protein